MSLFRRMYDRVARFDAWIGAGEEEPLIPNTRRSGWATASSPDEIIAAKIIESFATHFDDWKANVNFPMDCFEINKGGMDKLSAGRKEERKFRMSNSSLDIVIEVYSILYGEWISHEYVPRQICYDNAEVKGVKIEGRLGGKIVEAYVKLRTAISEAEKVARNVKIAMEENELKWNLAETLLGMKRTKEGALVSAIDADPPFKESVKLSQKHEKYGIGGEG